MENDLQSWKRRFAPDPNAEALVAVLADAADRQGAAGVRIVGANLARDSNAAGAAALVTLLAQEETAANAAQAIFACTERNPELLLPHIDTLFELLHWPRGKQIVCNAMRALACLAPHAPERVWHRRSEILDAYEHGSQRTREAAVRLFAALAESAPHYRQYLSPVLVSTLDHCASHQLHSWCTWVMPALTGRGLAQVRQRLDRRLDELPRGPRRRLERLVERAERAERADEAISRRRPGRDCRRANTKTGAVF